MVLYSLLLSVGLEPLVWRLLRLHFESSSDDKVVFPVRRCISVIYAITAFLRRFAKLLHRSFQIQVEPLSRPAISLNKNGTYYESLFSYWRVGAIIRILVTLTSCLSKPRPQTQLCPRHIQSLQIIQGRGGRKEKQRQHAL